MDLHEPIHFQAIRADVENAAEAVWHALYQKDLSATRVEHAGITVLALTNAVMGAVGMSTHPASIAQFLIQLGLRFLSSTPTLDASATMPTLDASVTLPPDLEVVNLQADPPKPTGL